MNPLLDRRLLVVTGKGGTGKTVTAIALARAAARSGKRVLLAELDATGDVGTAMGLARPLQFAPVEPEPNLFVMVMKTEAALQEYLQLNLRVPATLRLGPFARAFDFVATAAPGVREVLTIGKLCWEVKREHYDLVVADAPATGHVVSQLGSPGAIGELVDVGPLVAQTEWMTEMLRDPARTGAVIVTTPEELPVNETIELATDLRERSVSVATVVVNRVLPQLFVRREHTAFVWLNEHRDALATLTTPEVEVALRAGELATALREGQVRHLDRLQAYLAQRDAGEAQTPVLFVPQSFSATAVADLADDVTAALGDELNT